MDEINNKGLRIEGTKKCNIMKCENIYLWRVITIRKRETALADILTQKNDDSS